MHRQSGEWNKTQCTQISNLFTPNRRDRSIWQEKCKMFCGVFSEDGSRYVTASEDKYISIFDATTSQYKLLRRVKADNVNWRIFDMNLSKDAKRLAYCSWSNCGEFERMNTGKFECYLESKFWMILYSILSF